MAAYAGWPALAITDGFPDGDLHPNVGAIVYRLDTESARSFLAGYVTLP